MKRARSFAAWPKAAVSRAIPAFYPTVSRCWPKPPATRPGAENFRFWGGFEGAERRVLCTRAARTPGRKNRPPACVCRPTITAQNCRRIVIILARSWAWGLTAPASGICCRIPGTPPVFYAVVLADKAEFITANFSSAGHSPVHVEACNELPPHLTEGPARELHEATVSALRADAVLAAMMHTSRTKAAEYIRLRAG